MNKKMTGSALAALLIAGTTSFTAFAAMPSGTAVVGDKAFDLNYINLHASEADEKVIQDAVVSGEEIYVKKFDGTWINNLSGKDIDVSLIPAVTYKDEAGNEVKYAAHDGDEITGEGTVTEVKAVAVNKIKVTFDGAVDTAKANFTVKKGNSVREYETISWNEAKTEATINMISNLTDGEYTVAVTGLGEDASKTIKVENRRVDSVTINGDVTPIIKPKDEPSYVDVSSMISIYDQYGVAYDKTNSVYNNLEVTASLERLPDGTKYEFKTPANSDLLESQFVLSIVYTDTVNGIARTDSKTIKIGNETRIEEIAVSGAYLKKDGKYTDATINTGTVLDDSNVYAVKVDIKDQYGNTYTSDQLNKLPKGTLRTVNPYFNIASFETVENEVYGILANNLDTNSNPVPLYAGDTEFILISNFGKKASFTLNIEEAVKLKNIDIEWPEIIAGGDSGELKFIAYDQNGEEMTQAAAIKQLGALNNKEFGQLTTKIEDGKLKYTVDSVPADTQVVVAFLTPGNTFYQQTITLRKTKVAETISVKSLPKYATKGAVVKVNEKSVEVFDQYGRQMKADVTIKDYPNGFEITKDSGVEVITLQSGAATVEHKINVVKAADLAAIKADCSTELYVPLKQDGNSYVLNTDLAGKYDGTLSVYGETKGGSKVLLSGSEYSITEVSGLDITTGSGIQLENSLGLQPGKTKEVNVVIVPLIGELNAAVNTVKFNTATPVAKEINPVDSLVVESGEVTNTELLNLITVVDQYGIKYTGSELATYLPGQLTSIVINGVDATNNGNTNASIANAVSGKTFKVIYWFGSTQKIIEVNVK